MLKNISSVSDLLKLPPKIMTAISIASGMILFSPQNIVDKLYLADFKDEYGFVIGIIFVLASSILLCCFLIVIAKSIISKIQYIKFNKNRKIILKKLSAEEKLLIKEMMNLPDKTIKLPMNNGVVIKLYNYGIIQQAGTNFLTDYKFEIPYFLQPWVVEDVNEDPSLLL